MSGLTDTRTLRVRTMSWEADGVLSLVLAGDDGGDLPEFLCGAHLDVHLGDGLIRQYSLCGDPSTRDRWTIAVLLEPTSRGGSRFVHEVLRPGMELSVAGPRNNFPLVDSARYLFIAGGIGITPILPMVRAAAAADKDWTLLYGGRRRSSMAFLAELAGLGPRVRVRPEDEYGLLDPQGEIESLPADTAVYCCGPEPLISAVESVCASLGRDDPHVERFGARARLAAPDERESGEFVVVLAGSGRRVRIPAGRKITDVLEESGIEVATSCTEGFCGTCETEVIRGVPDHRDDYLSERDRASNKSIMICVSRSRSPEIELNL
ncbi:PDR/VanB family oxidoreductase [Mycobacterium sp. NPDC003449]